MAHTHQTHPMPTLCALFFMSEEKSMRTKSMQGEKERKEEWKSTISVEVPLKRNKRVSITHQSHFTHSFFFFFLLPLFALFASTKENRFETGNERNKKWGKNVAESHGGKRERHAGALTTLIHYFSGLLSLTRLGSNMCTLCTSLTHTHTQAHTHTWHTIGVLQNLGTLFDCSFKIMV